MTVRQDELDRRLVAALTRDGLLDEARIAAATMRAREAKTPLGYALVAEAGASAGAVRALMRSLNAGFDGKDEGALARHRDRVIARVALRLGEVEKGAWKAAIKLEGERRTQGARVGLGTLLVASGALAEAKAANIEKAFEKRFLVCADCFARSARKPKVGQALGKECPQCGAELAPGARVSWLRAEEKAAAPVKAASDAPASESTTASKEEPTTASKEEPTTASKEEPTTASKEEPATASKEESTAASKEEPTTASKEEPTTASKEEPTTASKEESTTASKEESTTASKEESTTASKEESTTASKEEAATDSKEESATAPKAEPAVEAPAATAPPSEPPRRLKPRTTPVAVPTSTPRTSPRLEVVLLAALAGAGLVLAVQAGLRTEASAHWDAFRGSLADARKEKSTGRIAEAGTRYAALLASVEGTLPHEAKDFDLLVAARAERSACDRFAACAREATPARFAALARTCQDEDVLLATCDAVSGATDPLVLVVLATREETAVAHRALVVASKLPPPVAAPVLVAAIEGGDEALARDAGTAALALDDVGAAAAVDRLLARFPRDEAFAKKASAETARWKDRAAVPALRRLARAEWPPVAESAIVALTALKSRDAIPELVLGLDGSAPVQTLAITALVSMGDDAVPAIGTALTKGQAAAARALLKIGTPGALDVIAGALPKLGWPERQLVLDAVLHERPPPQALSEAVEKLLDDVVTTHKKQDGTLSAAALALFARAAQAYEVTDAADYIASEVFFAANATGAAKLDPAAFGSHILRRTGGRLELRNYTDQAGMLYARGPTPVAVAVPAGETGGAFVEAGHYLVGIAYVVDGKEAYPTIGEIDVPAGKARYVQYGEPPADAEPDESQAPTANDEERRAKLKRALGRAFRRDQLIEEKRKALADMATGPFAKDKVTNVTTKHYAIGTDATGAIVSELATEIEAAYVEYTKYVPATVEETFVVRFFATQEGFDGWREQTTLISSVIKALVEERDLVKRTRAVAVKARAVDAGLAAKLVGLAAGLETISGRGELGLEEVDAFDDQLSYVEGMKDMTAKALALILAKVKAERIIADATGASEHGILLGYFNHETKELCIWESNVWLDTVRHEAFHQFLDARAKGAPVWLHEGLATYFEVYPKSGRNQSRIDELRRAAQTKTGYLDKLSLDEMFAAQRFDSLDYAVAWSFIYYLVDKDPGALGKILTKARDQQCTPSGVASVFSDYEETQKAWKLYMKALVRTR
jgi:hypothetical protein